ncbi:MAG TPA: hypothetical protein VGC41_18155 [Kofleriaceae bacterium]
MFRALLVIPFLVVACGKSAGSQDKDTAPVASGGGTPEKVAPPTGMEGGPGSLAHNGDKGPVATSGGTVGGGGATLHSDEGTLTVDKAEGKAGSELTSNITVTPASEFHVNVDFPTKITLEPTDGVKLMKTEFTAGGSGKTQGDASAFSEKSLAFAVKATADKPGSYEIKGTFKFAVCKVDQCFPKKQPITITVAAN